jgi:uncharacterized cupredoxin-like copper-binding protein
MSQGRSALAAGLVTMALGCSAVAAWAHGTAATATTVKVTEKEFTVKPVPVKAKAGKVTFSVRNVGKLEHEFVVIKTNLAPGKLPIVGNKASEKGRVGKVPPFKPGKTKTLTLTLKAGKYVLLCNVAGHYKFGQRAGFRAT